jgi:hypothetical protein
MKIGEKEIKTIVIFIIASVAARYAYNKLFVEPKKKKEEDEKKSNFCC